MPTVESDSALHKRSPQHAHYTQKQCTSVH